MTRAKAPVEASPTGALANSAATAATITLPSKDGSGSVPASGVVVEMRDGVQDEPMATKELVRATCRLQIDLSEMCDTTEARDAHRRRQCPGADGGCPACVANKTLRAARRECARIANVAMRLRWAADAELIDRYQIAHGRAPKGKEWDDSDLTQAIERVTAGMLPAARQALMVKCERWSEPKDGKPSKRSLYPYPLLCHMAPSIAAGIVSAIDQSIMQKWSECRWAALVMMDKSPPHYTWTNPIPLRKSDVALKCTDKKRYLLSFSISSRGETSRRGKEFQIPLQAHDAYQEQILSMLASDSSRMGAAQLTEDRKRPGRWYVRMAYRKMAAKSTATKSAAINKGILTFLAGVTEDGARWMYDGADVEAYLKQVQSRRQRYQRQVRASNRVGHGRTRTLRPIEHLQGQGEAWRDTRCQVIARRFVNWLVAEGVGRLYIDDFSGIRDQPPEDLKRGEWIWNRIQEWPFYKLQMKIISCCEENGIEAVIRNPKHISGTCPKCGSREVKYVSRKLHCGACRHVVHWDVAAAEINLRDGERERRGEKEIEPKLKKGSKKTKPKQ